MRPAFSNKLNEPKIELDKGKGEHLELRLGFAASTASSSVVLEKVRQLHETIPDLQLIAVEHPMPELARMIKKNSWISHLCVYLVMPVKRYGERYYLMTHLWR